MILRRLAANELMECRLVLRPDRPQEQCPSVSRSDCLFELARVRTDREARVGRLIRWHYADTNGDRQHALRVGQQRIDVDLRDFCDFRRDLRELDEGFGDLLEIGGRPFSVALQQGLDARLGDQPAGEVEIERRQADGLILHHLRDIAALAEQHDRPEACIDGDAEAELVMLIRSDVRTDGKPRKRDTRALLVVLAYEAPRRRFDRLRAFQVQGDAGADGADLARAGVAAGSDRDRETDLSPLPPPLAPAWSRFPPVPRGCRMRPEPAWPPARSANPGPRRGPGADGPRACSASR